MENVPKIISGKDLLYIEDMFKWNYNAYKQLSNYKDLVKDKDAKDIIDIACDMHYTHMMFLISILKGDSKKFYQGEECYE